MKSLMGMFAVAGLVLGGAVAATAQTASTDAAAKAQSSVQSSAEANELAARYMTSVQTELTSKVDTKNATVGQEVTARTKQNAKLADGTTLPKGTKLMGHVTQVQAQAKNEGRSGSLLAMTFDQAELKGGRTLQLRSVMQAVAPPANVSGGDDMMAGPGALGGDAGVSGSAGPVSTRGGLGGGAVGGGGLGSGVGGAVRGVGQTAGGLGQTAGSTAGGVARTTDRTLDSTARTTGGVVAQAGENVSGVARATAVPGVMLSTAATADTSGTLTAAGKNIALESGTQITLGVIAR